MPRTQPQLSPAERRAMVAELLSRRLLELASKGLLTGDDEDASTSDPSQTDPSEAPHGPR